MLNADITPALIIDEAQSLPYELLEEIRLLANIETPKEKLLPIILAGQPELADRLNHQSLRQLKQRVGLRCDLQAARPWRDRARTSPRASRSRAAQAPALFTREAVMMIHERSQRHSTRHQRHLPQRADQLVRARAQAGDDGLRARGVPRFRLGQGRCSRAERCAAGPKRC